MRLHHLEMTAFGPFAGTESVAEAMRDSLEELDGGARVLRATAPSRPVEGERGNLLVLRAALDHGADAHRTTLASAT